MDAGDYREGAAVVQTDDGMHMHIDADGKPLNGYKFLDLGPFHKGKATASDTQGWFHINRNGNAVYERRFRAVEPYYNGTARVELFSDALAIIDERGNTQRIIREAP